MVFEQPVVFIGDVVGKLGGGKLAVVVRGYQVTDVMKEGADHQFLIAPVPVGHGRRLQTMAVVVNLVPETLDMLLGPQENQGLLRLVFAVEILFLPGKHNFRANQEADNHSSRLCPFEYDECERR